VQEPGAAQLAVTVPTWRHRPGGPHLDGITPLLPDGTPFTFTLLAGVWLTDQSEPDRGNLYVWPGTHLRAGAFFAEHGVGLLTRPDELRPGPYPPIELGEATQAMGPAGSILLAHYLLAHNIGGRPLVHLVSSANRDEQQRRKRQARKDRLVREGKAHAALVFDGDLAVAWCQFGAVPGRACRQLAEIDQIVPPPAAR